MTLFREGHHQPSTTSINPDIARRSQALAFVVNTSPQEASIVDTKVLSWAETLDSAARRRMEESAAKNTSKPAKVFSCLRCYNRRVKCDRQQPCGGCIKSNTECVFRERPPPRRRKQRTQEGALLERLKQYETLLNQSGINPKTASNDAQSGAHIDAATPSEHASTEASQYQSPGSTDAPERAYIESKLLTEQDRSKFVDKYVACPDRSTTANAVKALCGHA